MSGRELQRIEVLSEVLARRRTEISAAAMLGLSTRQTRRLLCSYGRPLYMSGTHDYPSAARSIALNLREFCDVELFYPDMVADAARKAADHIKTADEFATGRKSCETSRTVGLVDRGDLLAAFGGELEGDFQSGGWPTPAPSTKLGAPYLDSEMGHSRKPSAHTHLYRRDKAFTPHPSATHPQLLLLGNGK